MNNKTETYNIPVQQSNEDRQETILVPKTERTGRHFRAIGKVAGLVLAIPAAAGLTAGVYNLTHQENQPKPPATVEHVVTPGQTLWQLGEKLNPEDPQQGVDDIVLVNSGLSPSTQIVEGSTINIPVEDDPSSE